MLDTVCDEIAENIYLAIQAARFFSKIRGDPELQVEKMSSVISKFPKWP